MTVINNKLLYFFQHIFSVSSVPFYIIYCWSASQNASRVNSQVHLVFHVYHIFSLKKLQSTNKILNNTVFGRMISHFENLD